MVIIFIGWVVIFFGTYYEDDIKDWALEKTGNSFIGEWSAAVIMTIVNYIFPWIVSFLDQLERWDFASETLRADLLKNYYTSMLNIIFFVAIQIIKLRQKNDLKGSGLECKEDEFTDEFLKLFTFELVARGAYYLYWNMYLKCKSKARKEFDWRTDFELSDEFVWFLVIQLQMYSAMLTYPIMAFICLIFSYLHCQYLIYRLTNQKVQPENASNDMSTGSLMNMYLNFTFVLACIFISIFFFMPMPRAHYWDERASLHDVSEWCGPFKSNNELSPIEEIGLFPQHGSFFNRFTFCFLI